MADYKIELGIGLRDTDFNNIKSKIKSLEDEGIKIKLDDNTIDTQIKNIETRLKKLDGIKIDLGNSIGFDSNTAIKSAQQVGQKIGESVTKSVKSSINIDDVVDKQVANLMNEYAIAGKKGSKAFNEIKQSLVDFRSGSGDINKVTSAISNNMRVINEAKKDYKELAEYIKAINASGAKIHLPDSIKQEYGDDFKTMLRQLSSGKLGNAFTTGNGMDFESFVVELNSILGDTIDLSHGAEAAFGDLVRKVNSTKGSKTLTGDDLFRSGILDMGDVVANVSTSLEQIENAEKEAARASAASTNIITQNEERKQQAYKATTDTVMYHAGVLSKLNKAETNGRFYGSNRGTGYFGTGHYFVDSATKHELDDDHGYSKLPYTSIDISQYDNLFRVTSDEIGYALHSFLGNLTRFTQGSDNFNIDELFAQFKNVFGDTIMDIKEFGSRVDQLKTFMTNSDFHDRSDSVSTQFMKSLGYGGVDTRGTSLADTRYGTVIYDLKEESILQANITDELQKQGQMLEKINYEKGQVFDKDVDARIQKELDAEAKRKEIAEEFKKSFDSTSLDFASESLDNAKNRINELDDAIHQLQSSLNNLDQEYKESMREMKSLGFDDDDLLLMGDEDEWKRDHAEIYKDSIADLSQEKARLQSEIPSLEEIYNRENQLANEAYEKAKQVVEQRHLETQQAQETSGVIENLKTTLETMKVDRSSIDTVIKDMEELGFTATDTSVKMKNGGFDITVNGVDSIGRAITEIRHLDNATDEISLVDRKISQSLTESDKFVNQQKKSVADLTNQINQLNRAAIDQNASRPIKDSIHLDALADKYDEITSAIQRMENASSDTFVDEQNNVRKLISEYKSLVSEYKNAENVSSKMKGTDFDSGLDIAKNDLEKFKAQAKDFPQITATIQELDRAIENVGDASSLNKFNDQLRVARSELAKVKSETMAINRNEKVGINVSGLESKIADIQRISPEIDRFETEIDGAKVSVQSLLNDLKQVKTQGDFSVVNSRFKAFADAAKAAGIAVSETAAKTKAAFAKDIKLNIEVGNFENQMDTMRAKFNSLSDANDKLRNSFEATEKAYKAMVDASKANTGDEVADRERLIQAEKEYAAALEKTNNLIKQQARADKISNDALRLQDDREIFQAKIDSWLTKNSAATERFGAKLKELRAAAETADRVELNHLEKELIKVDKAADKAGLKMMSLGDRIKSKAKEYMAYLSVAEVFMWIEQAARAMFDTVLEIDTAMTGLYRVTDLTSAQYDALFNNMIDSAKEYGATLNDIINATSDWVRAGFDADTALGLAEVTTMYQHISDLDYDTAAENLITAYNGFKNELDTAFSGDTVGAVNYIADIFNELDNNFAVTSAGLGEALTRSASALDLAGNTIQETAG